LNASWTYTIKKDFDGFSRFMARGLIHDAGSTFKLVCNDSLFHHQDETNKWPPDGSPHSCDFGIHIPPTSAAFRVVLVTLNFG